MTFVVLIMAFAEFCWALRIIFEHTEEGQHEIESFLSRAPLDAILRVQFHAQSAIVLFQLSTILSTLKGGKL